MSQSLLKFQADKRGSGPPLNNVLSVLSLFSLDGQTRWPDPMAIGGGTVKALG
jgi:hypothetical protein